MGIKWRTQSGGRAVERRAEKRLNLMFPRDLLEINLDKQEHSGVENGNRRAEERRAIETRVEIV